ncbi:MAG: hypothetical protein ABI041_20435 [Bdellovibrionia bacterium]
MKQKNIQIIILLSGFYLTGTAHAESTSPENVGRYEYDYPELSVVPRASERLKLESEKEQIRKFTNFLPVQISALSTLISGVASRDSSNSAASSVAMGVGIGWLVYTATLSLTYEPYLSGHRRVGPMAKNSLREQLTRERFAEEEIRSAAEMGNRIKWLSFVSNLGASIFMLSEFKETGSFNSSGNLLTGSARSEFTHGLELASLVLAFAPIIFKFHWSEVFDTQTEYKKRIYAPVALTTFFENSVTHRLMTGLMVKFSF